MVLGIFLLKTTSTNFIKANRINTLRHVISTFHFKYNRRFDPLERTISFVHFEVLFQYFFLNLS